MKIVWDFEKRKRVREEASDVRMTVIIRFLCVSFGNDSLRIDHDDMRRPRSHRQRQRLASTSRINLKSI